MAQFKNTAFCGYILAIILSSISLPGFASFHLTPEDQQWIKQNPVIKFTGAPNWLPYEAFNKKGKYVGIVAEHLTLIESLTGLKFKKIPVSSWTESLELASTGEVSVISGDAANVILNKRFQPVDSYSSNPVVIIMSLQQNYVSDLNEINNKKIAIIKDYGYTSDVFKTYPNIKFIEVENIQEGLEGVASNRFDAMLATLALASYTIADMGLSSLKIVGKIDVVMNLTLFVDKNIPRLHNILNKALTSVSLKESNKISQAWINNHYVEKIDTDLVARIVLVSSVILLFVVIWNIRLSKEIKRRKELERQNKEKEKELLSKIQIINQIHDSVIQTDAEGFITFWNKGAEVIFGYTSEEMLGLHFKTLYKKQDHDWLENKIIPELIKNDFYDYEIQLIPKVGNAFYCHVSLTLLYNELGKPCGMISYSLDIDKRKRTELALIRGEILLEKAQYIAKIGHWNLNPKTGEISGSDELFRIFELSKNEVSLERILDVLHPDDREFYAAVIQCGVEQGDGWDIEYRLICSNGEEKWVHAVGESITDGDSNVIELLGTIQDVTKEKLIDLELEEANILFKSMFESIPDAVIYADPERNIRLVNKATLALFGFDECELYGNKTQMLYASVNDFEQQDKNIFNLKSKISTSTKNITYKTKEGEKFQGETLGSAVKSSKGEILGFIGIIRDITEQSLLEQELESYRDTLEMQIDQRTGELVNALYEAERANNAKSEFLSNMSHELRTPLNAILGFGQMLELKNDNFNELQKSNVDEILYAGEHLLSLINEVLNLAQIESGKIEVNIEAVKLSDIFQECLALIQLPVAAMNIEVVDNISGYQHFVNADYMRLKQVLLNLLSNAVKYNQKSGKIIIDSRLINADVIRISVTDTGVGLVENELSKLFVPFERLNAKENIEGTGIGLTITRHLVELMGGSIGVESTQGKGSIFWIELPLAYELESIC